MKKYEPFLSRRYAYVSTCGVFCVNGRTPDPSKRKYLPTTLRATAALVLCTQPMMAITLYIAGPVVRSDSQVSRLLLKGKETHEAGQFLMY